MKEKNGREIDFIFSTVLIAMQLPRHPSESSKLHPSRRILYAECHNNKDGVKMSDEEVLLYLLVECFFREC